MQTAVETLWIARARAGGKRLRGSAKALRGRLAVTEHEDTLVGVDSDDERDDLGGPDIKGGYNGFFGHTRFLRLRTQSYRQISGRSG